MDGPGTMHFAEGYNRQTLNGFDLGFSWLDRGNGGNLQENGRRRDAPDSGIEVKILQKVKPNPCFGLYRLEWPKSNRRRGFHGLRLVVDFPTPPDGDLRWNYADAQTPEKEQRGWAGTIFIDQFRFVARVDDQNPDLQAGWVSVGRDNGL